MLGTLCGIFACFLSTAQPLFVNMRVLTTPRLVQSSLVRWRNTPSAKCITTTRTALQLGLIDSSSTQTATSTTASTVSLKVRQPQVFFHAWKRFIGSTTEYYYDSQSGKHVPRHDESRVHLLLTDHTSAAEPESLDQLALRCASMAKQGFAAVVLRSDKNNVPSDALLLLGKALQQASVPDAFQCWVPNTSNEKHEDDAIAQRRRRIVHMVEYDPENTSDTQEQIVRLVHQQIPTAIACRADADAILTANGVASILDATSGGGDYVFLQGDKSDAMVQLAEELGYIDVEGSIMKARLVVDLTQLEGDDDCDEVLEECLLAGINKYVVNDFRLSSILSAVEEQGKTCIVGVSG